MTLTSQPPNVRTVAENTSVTLTCESTGGEPSPTLSIIRGKIPLQTRITSARRVVAAVRLDRFDDQKTFVCSATSLGIDGSLNSASVTYNVQCEYYHVCAIYEELPKYYIIYAVFKKYCPVLYNICNIYEVWFGLIHYSAFLAAKAM